LNLKRKLVLNIKNIPGWRTRRKIVVFISDDWGDKRIRSDSDYEKLIAYGLPLNKSEITKYDTVADEEDLYRLFEVLSSVKDKNNRSAVFSPFTIMSTPDFKKIAESGFQEYDYLNFTQTLEASGNSEKILAMWNQGMEEKIFMPEYHGRDHLNVPMWIQALRSGNELVRHCFHHHYAHVKAPGMKVSPAVAFYFDSEESFHFLNHSLKEGIHLFRETFGKNPAVFNPPNGMFHTDFYGTLAEMKVKTISTKHFRKQPGKGGTIESKYFTFGKKSHEGIVHFVSNAAFEPVNPDYKGIEQVMGQIKTAFRWRKPALINTHRVNYVAGRDLNNREKGLNELSKLLKRISSEWPDVEFMSAGRFAQVLNKTIVKKDFS
jgi:hypothetical protein